MFPNKPFLKLIYKMIGFGAWKLTWGNHVVKEPSFDFFWGSPVFAGELHHAWCPAHFVNP